MGASDDGTDKVRAWLGANLGEVRDIRRQPRWRPVWFADVERDGEVLELCVRGDRLDMPLIFPLAHEMRLQALMHEHGIPTAKVHGWIDDPMAYVMDRVGGSPDFEKSTDKDRRAAVDDYLQILARLHALDIGPFVDGGIMRAKRPEDSGMFGFGQYERVYRKVKVHPDPFTEFCLGWLHRNPPDSKGREAAIVWDSGQFHHAGGRIVAVRGLRTVDTADEFVRYKLRTLFRLARHAHRVDEIGGAVSDADLDDLHQLLGHRPEDWFEGEAELERFVLADAAVGQHDEVLLPLLHKRNLRAQMLLGPAGSAMARHLPIQSFRD